MRLLDLFKRAAPSTPPLVPAPANRLLANMETKTSKVSPMFALYGNEVPRVMEQKADAFAKEGYNAQAACYACVNLIAKAAAGIPLVLFQDDEKLDDHKHPILKLLRRPNPWQGWDRFAHQHLGYKLISGNSYLEGVSLDAQSSDLGVQIPKELYSHRPDRITILLDKILGTPRKYRYELAGSPKEWEIDPTDGKGPMLHETLFNPTDDFYGLSPIAVAAIQIDQRNAAGKWNLALLQNGGRPSGALVYDPGGTGSGTLGDNERRTLEATLRERVANPESAGRPMILDGGLKWEQMGMSSKDMDFIEGMNISARDICSVYAVPIQMLGIPGSQTFANYTEARASFYEDTVIPFLNTFLEELNHWLIPEDAGIEIRADVDKIDALSERRAAVWTRAKDANWLTLNEKRELTGFEPLDEEGADTLYMSSSEVPLAMGNEDPNAEDAGGAPGGAEVQQQALNGLQISTLTETVSQVSKGTLAPDAAKLVLKIGFPNTDPTMIDQLVDAAKKFEPAPDPMEQAKIHAIHNPPAAGGDGPPAPGKDALALKKALEKDFAPDVADAIYEIAYGTK